MGGFWIFVAIAVVTGGIFAGVGLTLERGQSALRQSGVAVNVEVIGMHRSRDSDGDVTYRPEYRITSGVYEGKTWESTFSSNPPMHEVGDRERGFYDASSGRIATKSASRKTLLFSMMFSSIGMGIMLSGLLFWLRARGI